MNNNFTFNFVDDPDEEKKEPKIEVTKVEEKLPEVNKNKNKKGVKGLFNSKKIVNFLIGFVVVIIVGLTLGNNTELTDNLISNENSNTNNNNSNNNTEITGDISSFLANKNYSFDIEITEVIDNETKVYKLIGINKDGIITGTSTLGDKIIEYSYEVKKYYIIEDGEKKESDLNTIYHETNYKYSNIEVIEKYISKGVLESSSSKLDDYSKNYIVKIEDILYTFIGDETISIILKYNKEEYNIEVDYSNLLRLTDGKTTTYYVKQNYKLIDDTLEE